MTTIKYNISPGICYCEMSGHANSGKCGEDVVCAALSILMRLFSNLDNYTEETGDGFYSVECKGTLHNINVFAIVCSGFEMMAEQDPEHEYLYVNPRRGSA